MNAFVDAAEFGFAPESTGVENAQALQQALDQGGTIVVGRPGTYKVSRTVYIGSNTTLIFGNGVFVRKEDEEGPFSHVILNKGALTRTYDEHVAIHHLQLIVNKMDYRIFKDVFGLHGQLAFFYIKDLRIEGFRCMDLGKAQYGIHICTFEDIVVDDVIIKGEKDGVHLGRGKRFRISNGVFETYDDAIALNAHDYDVGNPELGWIEDGVIENCHDLARAEDNTCVGFFCRILAGAWTDWAVGMEVQKSDTVVSNGRLYRVKSDPNGTLFRSHTQPVHEKGTEVLDGIPWVMVQEDVTYTCGVRNVTFRNIWLRKARTSFSIHFDNDRFSRSYYPGAEVPGQELLMFDNVHVMHDQPVYFLSVNTPINMVSIANTSFQSKGFKFHGNKAMTDYLETRLNLVGCIFKHNGVMDLVENQVDNKHIMVKTTGSMTTHEQFQLRVTQGPGIIQVQSDLQHWIKNK